MNTFHVGQCWMSETEPELGLGFVRDQDHQAVTIEFPAAEQTRRYGKRTAPLRRLEFRVGETIQSSSGDQIRIEKVETRGQILWYIGSDLEIAETDLSPKLKLQRPIERFLAGHWDPISAFSLRRHTLDLWHRMLRSPLRGMIGPRAQLLPHQLYVVDQVSSRGLPQALLADEVGLGKTIEAGWILHRLIVTGRIHRVLIIVPGALVNQWFVELFRRFNLSFWVPDSQSDEGIEAEDLFDQERVILSIESLKALQEAGGFDEADWDMVIVDEAHRISWTPEEPSVEYRVLESVAARARGLLLLTATPEQLGLEGHFARLRLIDPVRFASLERFKEEHRQYQEVVRIAEPLLSDKAPSAKERKALEEKLQGKVLPETLATLDRPESRRAALLALIDHYGTGRVYFRNSRQVVELEHCFFPKRSLEKYPLQEKMDDLDGDAMVRWLGEFGQSHRGEKTLLICSSVKQVIEWEKRLREDYALKAVAFHEKLPLLARDRNAAYFEDPDGATILLSSEIGGEGRNFQHARHLILADLPADPDVLEQRIGRLDRIGQVADIQIHVPYAKGSREEKLVDWHQKVFRAFDAPPKGAGAIFERYREELDEALSSRDGKSFDALIRSAQKDYAQALDQIESGRDRLIEVNSFDPVQGTRLSDELENAERPEEMREYLEQVLDTLGIHSEDLDADSLFIEPGDSMYVSYFPALPPDGIRVTFSRSKALARDDLALMSWDHPMLTETMESIAGQEVGNVSVAMWKNPSALLECSFVLEPSATDPTWYADQFLPTEAIRVVLDGTGKDISSEWSWNSITSSVTPPSTEAVKLARQIPGDRFRALLAKALKQAEQSASAIRNEAIKKMNTAIDSEIIRLQSLRDKNSLVSGSEIEWWSERKQALESAFEDARVRLDAFLLVVPDRSGK